MSTSIMLLKAAASSRGGGALREALKSAGVAKTIGKGVRGVVRGAKNVGGDLAEGLGASRAVGEVGGIGALAGGSYLGGKKAKEKKDRWMYQHGF